MSSTPARSEQTARSPNAAMKLEVVAIPVSDVDRAKRFYGGLGWRLDADLAIGPDRRAVQLTPPGSDCSIHFGQGTTTAAPASAHGMISVAHGIASAPAAGSGHA